MAEEEECTGCIIVNGTLIVIMADCPVHDPKVEEGE